MMRWIIDALPSGAGIRKIGQGKCETFNQEIKK
jgi:hypothetical protein